eukprot:TRINITY_DN2663_c3_g1_i1.p1 TRINITY_DN2663_c3_g1~~TRINITY_DN2663_c3_g1_i1.p1  ORF type:complete len:126 (+),score=23.39 TRINITY_DN2663_c3_g1_i1:56-433(+)
MPSAKPQNPKSQAPAVTEEQKAAEETVRKGWLNRTVKITMTDDRLLVGKVICIDGYGNVILQEVHESRIKKLKDGSDSIKNVVHRHAICPPKAIKQISVAKKEPVTNTSTPPPAGSELQKQKVQG